MGGGGGGTKLLVIGTSGESKNRPFSYCIRNFLSIRFLISYCSTSYLLLPVCLPNSSLLGL